MKRTPFPAEKVVTAALSLVGPAESSFSSRWRLSTLRRVDADLHEALVDQQRLYDLALLTGTDEEVGEHSSAMVRGWRAACAALEGASQPHDAYLVGYDPLSCLTVVVGDHPASLDRVQEGRTGKEIFITPDEVAQLVAGARVFHSVKATFPEAELVGHGSAPLSAPTNPRKDVE